MDRRSWRNRLIRRFGAAATATVLTLGVLPGPVVALSPSDGGPFTLLPVTINASAGDQFDPHVSGDLAAYTGGANIRYYNFFSGNDAQVPGALGAVDNLSDVSNGKIVFSRLDSSFNQSIMVFDTVGSATTEIDAQPASQRTSGAIGSDTVAYIDFGPALTGELFASQLGVGGTTTRVTTDGRYDQFPSVAPLGDLIVYESCLASPSNCDIHQAGWNGSIWAVTNLTNNAEPEANADSDGVIVVYDANRAGERDIYWQSVGGGTEEVLSLAGTQRNPSVSAGIIAFESIAIGDSAADLFVYQVTTNRSFRITSTPADESLNDVFVLPDGKVRVVWASGATGARDVYGATLTLASPPCQGTLAVLGTSLPTAPASTITQGGAPNFADTYITPYTATQAGTIASWKAQFTGGLLGNGGIGVPSGIQLKVLRQVSTNMLQVVGAGVVHDPRPVLQARFDGSYPYFQSTDSVIEFSDPGLTIQSGDVIGLTIKSDPAVGAYLYPLVSQVGTRLVLRDVGAGGTIDLGDPFTDSLGDAPALQVNVNACSPDTTPPILAPMTHVMVALPLNSTATSMSVTFPIPTATDDSGTATVTTNPLSGTAFPVGTTTVSVTATDPAGNTATGSFTVTVLHNFSGFLQPVDNLPTLNLVNAGRAIPVKFSLSGNKGLNIFVAGYPKSQAIACDSAAPVDGIEQTVTAGGSSLQYNALTDVYTYVWKTDKAWAGTCRQLVLGFADGTFQRANFKLK